MPGLSTLQLDSLPSQEADDIEYKSGLTAEKQLKRELQNAASAFWNSGGGILLAGVEDDGTVRKGIPAAFGRQSLGDWLAQVLSSVRPMGRYDTRIFVPSDDPAIGAGRCVLAVQFLPSSALPHQSADHKYYIRAGAHTVPASHDIVDALHARRHFQNPRLVHLARLSHWTNETDFLHIEIIAATDAVALDVEIDFSTRPTEEQHLTFPILVPIIDRSHSFGFRFEVRRELPFTSELVLRYRDLRKHSYSYDAQIDASKCVPPWNLDSGSTREITDELRELTRTIERKDLGLRFT